MKVLHLFPPNYRQINQAFNIRGKPVIFCYGDTIYNPSRIDVPPCLIAHETVHSRQQGSDPDGWWRRYIDDLEFRLREEVEAHRAEYEHLGQTQKHLDDIARRLSSQIYGRLVTFETARLLVARS